MNKILDGEMPTAQADTLDYMADMAASLSALAAKSNCEVLSFLFAMAQAEALQLASDGAPLDDTREISKYYGSE